MTYARRAALAALGLLIFTAGCGKNPAPAAAPAPVETAARPDADADRAAREARERAEREAAEARRRAEQARAALEARVFFDYDEATIRNDARATLDAKLPVLREDGSIRLRVEGHADERGSTEYNLALGARRAQTLVDYLAGYGIDRGRLESVSFGEERPLVRGAGEGAWSQNRRGEFVVTAGRVAATPEPN